MAKERSTYIGMRFFDGGKALPAWQDQDQGEGAYTGRKVRGGGFIIGHVYELDIDREAGTYSPTHRKHIGPSAATAEQVATWEVEDDAVNIRRQEKAIQRKHRKEIDKALDPIRVLAQNMNHRQLRALRKYIQDTL